LVCHFYHQSMSCPGQLESADPMLQDGAWVIDLGTDQCISSVKNCRLDYKGIPYCYVRKVEADMIELESKRVIDDLCLFAIGVASLLCSVWL
jgi:hypothetical protein